ncbi:glycosyltransferase [soil metagenome]
MLSAPDSLPVFLSRRNPFLTLHPPDSQLCVSVVIPARNEADNLEHTLNALRIQRQADGTPIPWAQYEVLILLNNCTDCSVAVAESYQQRYPDFPLRIATIQLAPENANVGTARRLLMDEAYRRLLQVGRPHGIIASTDADTIVDCQWIEQIRAEISQGCEVVAGRISTRPDGNQVRLNHLRDVTYRMLIARLEAYLDPLPFDPWPRHFQHFGASLALTCVAYKRVGGLPEVPHLEDEALYAALLRTDTRIRKSPTVRVTTSTRMHGRVAIGFSEQLRYWETLNQTNQSQLVESAGAIICRIQNRQRLRSIWQNRATKWSVADLQLVTTDLLIDTDWLKRQLEQASYFGQLWQEVETKMATGAWAMHWKLVPITTAIRELRDFLNAADTSND